MPPAMLSVRKSRRPLILVTATCQSYLERAASETNVGDSLRLIDSSADQHDTEPDLQGQLYRIHLAPSWMARHHYTAVSPRPTLAWAPHAPPCLLPHLDAGFMGWLLEGLQRLVGLIDRFGSRFGDLLELLAQVCDFVRVILAHHLPVGSLDLLLGRHRSNTENLKRIEARSAGRPRFFALLPFLFCSRRCLPPPLLLGPTRNTKTARMVCRRRTAQAGRGFRVLIRNPK